MTFSTYFQLIHKYSWLEKYTNLFEQVSAHMLAIMRADWNNQKILNFDESLLLVHSLLLAICNLLLTKTQSRYIGPVVVNHIHLCQIIAFTILHINDKI